jgi:hypothetical protein
VSRSLPVLRDPASPSYNDVDKPSVLQEIEKPEPHREVLATGWKPRREFSANCGIAARAGTPVESALEACSMCGSIVRLSDGGNGDDLAGDCTGDSGPEARRVGVWIGAGLRPRLAAKNGS